MLDLPFIGKLPEVCYNDVKIGLRVFGYPKLGFTGLGNFPRLHFPLFPCNFVLS